MYRGLIHVGALLGCGVVVGCSDFQDRLQGYPKQDTVIHLDSASSNQIAHALSQIPRIKAMGDAWELPDPTDTCTVHVQSKGSKEPLALDLRDAQFAVHRDRSSQRYYATIQNGNHVMADAQQRPLRLVEASIYHDVFFAEGYLQALAQKCQQQRQLQAHVANPSSS